MKLSAEEVRAVRDVINKEKDAALLAGVKATIANLEPDKVARAASILTFLETLSASEQMALREHALSMDHLHTPDKFAKRVAEFDYLQSSTGMLTAEDVIIASMDAENVFQLFIKLGHATLYKKYNQR